MQVDIRELLVNEDCSGKFNQSASMLRGGKDGEVDIKLSLGDPSLSVLWDVTGRVVNDNFRIEGNTYPSGVGHTVIADFDKDLELVLLTVEGTGNPEEHKSDIMKQYVDLTLVDVNIINWEASGINYATILKPVII